MIVWYLQWSSHAQIVSYMLKSMYKSYDRIIVFIQNLWYDQKYLQRERERDSIIIFRGQIWLMRPKILHFTWYMWKWVATLDVQELYQGLLQSKVHIVVVCVWERDLRSNIFVHLYLNISTNSFRYWKRQGETWRDL